jgi:DNA-binding protein HU-beta
MTKEELTKEIALKTGVSKFEVFKILNAFMDTIRTGMAQNNDIYLRSFGTFHVKKRAKKTARNISRNITVIIPEHFVPAFKPAKEFIESIKAKKV